MSRKGAAHGPAAKKREVYARIQEAAARAAAGAEPEEPTMPPEVQAQMERHMRSEQVFIACKARIVGPYRSLWPPESIGAAIAETWMQEVIRRLHAQAQAAPEQTLHERAAAVGLVVAS